MAVSLTVKTGVYIMPGRWMGGPTKSVKTDQAQKAVDKTRAVIEAAGLKQKKYAGRFFLKITGAAQDPLAKANGKG